MIRLIYLTIDKLPPEAMEYPFSFRAYAAALRDEKYKFSIAHLSSIDSCAELFVNDPDEGDIFVFIPASGAVQVYATKICKIISRFQRCKVIVAGKYAIPLFAFWTSRGYIVLLNQIPDTFLYLIKELNCNQPLSQIPAIAYQSKGIIIKNNEAKTHEPWIRDLKLMRFAEESRITVANINTAYEHYIQDKNFNFINTIWISRSEESVIEELKDLLAVCHPSIIAFNDPEMIKSESISRSISNFLRNNFEGLWSTIFTPGLAEKNKEIINEMVKSGLYRANLIAYSGWGNKQFDSETYHIIGNIKKDIMSLVNAGVFIVSINIIFGIPGERMKELDEIMKIGLEILEYLPGRIEIWAVPFDPFGIGLWESQNKPAGSLIRVGTEYNQTISENFSKFAIMDIEQLELTSKMGSFQSEIMAKYMELLDKVPYDVALTHFDMNNFYYALSAWKESFFSVPHIYCYAKAYSEFQNNLITDPTPDRENILSCFPTRTQDIFAYTEDENVILKLFLNKLAILDEVSSYIYKLSSGNLTGYEIVDQVVRDWDISEEQIENIKSDVSNFLISLEKNFALVLIKAPRLQDLHITKSHTHIPEASGTGSGG